MKQLFLIGTTLIMMSACHEKPKREVGSQKITLRDTEKVSPAKKRIVPKKTTPPPPTLNDTLSTMFTVLISLHKEEIKKDSLPDDEWVGKHIVIQKSDTDSTTETLLIQKEDSTLNRYRIWYAYQNTIAETDTIEDIIVSFFKDTLGVVQYALYQHEQYIINDSLKQSKTFIPSPSSYDITPYDLRRIIAVLRKN